ncbi:sulfatase-like hydrolase/transferase [Variovorax sp. dw_954]|uniref:LTA synthase family protein n=1 Tax=Variovorax sp. dw_954 TaxID=2720078 RepID=UPI001BD5146E|nr:sulfatase-like hydrolase/transferase [Variovorax sp. dw_954]
MSISQPGAHVRPPSTGGELANSTAQRMGPWKLAFLLVIPLAAWLAFAKTLLVMDGLYGVPKGDLGPMAIAGWLAWFQPLRFLAALFVGWCIQRLFFRRQRWVIPPVALVVMLGLALAFTLRQPGTSVLPVLARWASTAVVQCWALAVCLWRDALSIAATVLVFGAVIRLAPRIAHTATITLLQVIVIALCALVGIDLAYQFATGQPANTMVLLFALQNAQDMVPLVKSEVTSFRVVGLVGGVVLALAWTWRQRALVRQPVVTGPQAYVGGAIALVGTLALLLPAPSPAVMEVHRYAEGTLVTLARTAMPSAASEAEVNVEKEFQRTGRPPWYSAGMTFKATDKTQRKNVVVVMMESIRAQSSTVTTPQLPTMPFLKRLADQGLMVEDMSVVSPRTTMAWVAVLDGQYPLANQGTARWAAANENHPRIRSLPSALREAGYATSFFTPTDIQFLSDPQVIRSIGFEHVQSERDLAKPGDEWPTYFGIADEKIVDPIMAWTATQVQAKRPFMTTIMTNVGHHDFRTPSTWKKIHFEGVDKPSLQAYYNCLAYIDSVLAQLMDGYAKLGVLDDTIFVFLGDHGVMLEEHDAKQSFNILYEEGVRIPFVVYAPGVPGLKGTRVQGARQQIDILPTIAQLLGYQIEGARLPGQSLLVPVDANRDLYFTSSITGSMLGTRRGTRKYLYPLDGTPMLTFDLDKDPVEATPVQNVPADELAQARTRMLEWQKRAQLSLFARPDPSAGPDAPWLDK